VGKGSKVTGKQPNTVACNAHAREQLVAALQRLRADVWAGVGKAAGQLEQCVGGSGVEFCGRKRLAKAAQQVE
jgi:hypothetical protein